MEHALWNGCSWLLTMLLVLVAWVFFRANDLDKAYHILASMFTLAGGVPWAHPFVLLALGLLTLQHLAALQGWRGEEVLAADRWYTPLILFFMLGLAILFYPKGFAPFVYFQF